MKNLFLLVFISLSASTFSQETVKSKALKLKYTPPAGWNAQEFGSPTSVNWEEQGNALCKCSGVSFFRSHKDGKMNVVVYPSTQSGLDSIKRNFVGNLRFDNVEKYDKTKNKFFSFEKKRSSFTDIKTNKKSFEVIRYYAKMENYFYIIYAWQENMNALSPSNEKEIFEMINAIEPIK